MKVVFSATGAKDNGRVAAIGTNSLADLKRQIRDGLSREDLQALGGQLVLNPQPLPPGSPPGPDPKTDPQVNQLTLPRFKHLSGADLSRIAEALEELVSTGERRIWLLYSRIDNEKNQGHRTDHGTMLILGFVSAQVMHVEVEGTDAGPSKLSVILQPSMKITATAVTDANRRHLGPRPIHNPYICKVRIVD
jgi:hypothetical protein